jgi:hypothetical protein
MKKTFLVTVVRTSWASLEIEVEADSAFDASNIALERGGDLEFPNANGAEYAAEGICEKVVDFAPLPC